MSEVPLYLNSPGSSASRRSFARVFGEGMDDNLEGSLAAWHCAFEGGGALFMDHIACFTSFFIQNHGKENDLPYLYCLLRCGPTRVHSCNEDLSFCLSPAVLGPLYPETL